MKRWVQSDDGSYTAYSSEYDEHYHSTKDGALNESLKKHIEPAFRLHAQKEHLRIIDICFGLGFNTLLSLHYRDAYHPDTTLEIYSPELDGDLVASLVDFPYPGIFEPYRNIITDIEYLKAVGLNPWQGASSRRRMESRFTYTEDLTVNGKAVHVEIGTSVSCTYVRYSVTVTIDGIATQRRPLWSISLPAG